MEPPYLYCPRCNNDQPLTLFAKTCSRCGSVLLVGYDYVGIAEEIDNLAEENASVGPWKYSKLLPPLTGSRISLGEGGTFLQRSSRLAEMLGVRSLYLKNESTNPTGSFIDRGVALEVSEAIASRIREVQCMPTGNLGASLAAYAARAGIECTIGIAYNINPGKLLQMIAYDAHLRIGEIAPSRDPRCLWVTPVDPYILEGEKTVVFEVWEQLRYMSNFHIIAPMGTGGLVTMLWKGMKELVNIGKAEKDACKLVGVQASGCAPIVDAFKSGTTVMVAKDVETLAIDLKVPHPPLGDVAIEAIRSTKGSAIAVTDGEILEAARLLAKTEGIFAEPVSASTVAALKRMLETKEIDRQDQVICIITGAGLKDPSATLRLLEKRRRLKFLAGQGHLELRVMGKTKRLILQLFSERQTYGYAIWKILKEKGISIRIPCVYQHISELEALGLIERSKTLKTEGKPEKCCYTLTPRGRETLAAISHLQPSQ